MHPRDLQSIAKDALYVVLDMENFEVEQHREIEDKERLRSMREHLIGVLNQEIKKFIQV